MLIIILMVCLLTISARGCPHGWVKHEQSCYHFSHDMETWPGAYTMCKIMGGQLLEFENIPEEKFVESQALTLGKRYWIGLSDVNEEGTWIWMTSHTALEVSNWGPGEPTGTNTLNEIENCAEIVPPASKWNDYDCSNKNYYICEKVDDSGEIVG